MLNFHRNDGQKITFMRNVMNMATDYGRPMKLFFSLKSRTFGQGQTNWDNKFWGVWGIFGPFISTHFGTVSPLSMFSINQPLFLQKTKSLYPNPNVYLGLGLKESGI